MKKVSLIIVCIVCIMGLWSCGSKPVPDWKNASFHHMEHFKQYSLSGDERRAVLTFRSAISEIKKSGDLTVLAKAYLTKCALQVATLEEVLLSDFEIIHTIAPDRANDNFYAFLKGDFEHVAVEILPRQYRSLFVALTEGTILDINQRIETIQDPLSRLLAAGLAVRHDRFDTSTLMCAVDTASREGWKKALLAYLERMKTLSEKNGNMTRAEILQKKIDIIRNNK